MTATLKQLTPPNSELLELAEQHPAPQEWWDEEPQVTFDVGEWEIVPGSVE